MIKTYIKNVYLRGPIEDKPAIRYLLPKVHAALHDDEIFGLYTPKGSYGRSMYSTRAGPETAVLIRRTKVNMKAFRDCFLRNYYEQAYVKIRYTDFARLDRRIVINEDAQPIPQILTVPTDIENAWVLAPDFWARDSYAIWRLEQRRFMYTANERLLRQVEVGDSDSDSDPDSDPGFKVNSSPTRVKKNEPNSYED